MWRHEGKKKKKSKEEKQQQDGLNRFSSWVQPRKCPAPRYHRPPLGDECDEESGGGNKRWVDQKCEWRVA